MSVISGIFVVDKLKEKDAEGFERIAVVHNRMEENMSFECFLPPYLRASQCGIQVGSQVFAFVDTVTGLGAALYGMESADVDFVNRNNYHYTKTLTVDKAVTMNDILDVQSNITTKTGNVKASIGDCVATTVSLKNHMHTATLAVSVEGSAGVPPAALPVVAAGSATGTSNPPVP